MPDVVADIKDRIDIVNIVSQYVTLKKAGVNYKGACPFHSEKTPSFVVSSEKQIFHCFGCHKGGDVFTFLQEIEGITFIEAMRFLAERAGVKLDEKKLNGEKNDIKDQLFEIHELATAYFEKKLHQTDDGKKVMDYLRKRGLQIDIIKEFRLGFAPDMGNSLFAELAGKGFGGGLLDKSGLVTYKKIGGEAIDRFRNRLIFPIYNNMGRICGFAGRALSKEQMPKYLNSPESPIYNKSKLLYGFYQAKNAIKEKDTAILVEGYFDVLMPFQAGYKNIVATCGTALTADHLRYLIRFTENAITSFDADDAGISATIRSYRLLKDMNFFVKTINDFGGKDPADFVRDGGDFARLIENSRDFLEFYIDYLLKLHDIKKSSGLRKILNELLPLFKEIDLVSLDYYVGYISLKSGLKKSVFYDQLNNLARGAGHFADFADAETAGRKISTESVVLGILLKYPNFLVDVESVLNPDYFEELKDVYKAMIDQYNASRIAFATWDYNDLNFKKIREQLDFLSLSSDEYLKNIDEDKIFEELEKLCAKLAKNCLERRKLDLKKRIFEAEEEGELGKVLNLQKEMQQLF